MACRDATEAEVNSIQEQGWRDATPQEEASIQASSGDYRAIARQKLEAKNPLLFKDEPNVVRERQTVLGEIKGGFQQARQDIQTAFSAPDPSDIEAYKALGLSPFEAGANIFVAGTFIFGKKDRAAAIKEISSTLK